MHVPLEAEASSAGTLEQSSSASIAPISSAFEAKLAPPWVPASRVSAARRGNHALYPQRCAVLQLHQEILDFCALLAPTEEERRAREAVIEEIRDAVSAAFKSVETMGGSLRMEVFGSTSTGLCVSCACRAEGPPLARLPSLSARMIAPRGRLRRLSADT